MDNQHSSEEIRACLDSIEFGVVSTLDENKIKSRAMHFAQDGDLNFYLASVKGDPKIGQILERPSVSLLLIKGEQGFPLAKEVEVVGSAEILKDEKEREAAFNLLAKKSPIVANMQQAGALAMLEAIRVSPSQLKYRVVEEIIRGVGPTVLEFKAKAAERAHYYFGWENFKEKAAAWFTELRAPFLTAAVIPVFLGSVIAWEKTGNFSFAYFLLTLLGGIFLHLGTNVVNDYFDHKSGNDEANTEYVRPFSGGSRMIQKGKLSPSQVLAGALFFFALGSLIGFCLVWARGIEILFLGAIGVFSGFFYSAPPFRLAGRGIGEWVVGLNFGVLMTLGAYFVQAQSFSWEAAVASLPVALLIAAVLYINEFPDFNADKAVSKNHLVVRLGKEAASKGYIILMWLVYISIVLGVLFKIVSPFVLLGLLTLPRAMRAMRVMKLNFNNTLYLVPANADTVLVHLYTGLLVSLAYVLQKVLLG